MSRTGLKTFVLSFCVSLFMIFLVNGIFWHMRTSNSNEDVEISNKNIVLFLRDSSLPSHIKAAPVRKIALSTLADIPLDDAENKNPLSDEISADIVYRPENEIIMAGEVSDTDFLNGSSFLDDGVTPENQPEPEKIVENFETIIKNPPKEIKLAALENIDTPLIFSEAIPDKTPPSATKKAEAQAPAPTKSKITGIIPLVREGFDSIKKDNSHKDKEIKGQKMMIASLQNDNSRIEKALPKKKNRKSASIPLIKESASPKKDTRNIVVAKETPTNMVALADKDIPIKSMSDKLDSDKKIAERTSENWKQMSETKAPDSPWVVAKSAGTSANAMLKNEEYYKKDSETINNLLSKKDSSSPKKGGSDTKNIKLASETVQNLLIPIPEEIINNENLVPQLESSQKTDKAEKNIKKETSLAAQFEKNDNKNKASESDSKKNIINSLSSIFNADSAIQEVSKAKKSISAFVDGSKKQLKRKAKRKSKIMPTEMRLSFQPNRAEISGQTLRWIQAFATRTAEDNSTAIEIRIDGTNSMDLQQRRLNLLHNILTNKGVGSHKIKTVFTTREPNSFIIRTINLTGLSDEGNKNENININREGYYLQW